MPNKKEQMRLKEEDYATLHEEFGCDVREIVAEEDFDGELDFACVGCGPRKKADEKKARCVYPECNKQTHFITSGAYCEKCPPYEVPHFRVSARTGRKRSLAFECIKPTCEDGEYLTEEGECKRCGEFEVPSADGLSCKSQLC